MDRDRLSELPQALILHILSFLPIRDVVKTSLLSKYWVNLWTTVPCLTIDENEEPRPRTKRFSKFVNGALRRWKGTNIQKFSLTMDYSSLEDNVHAWTLFALKNKVQDLEIRVIYQEYSILHDLYSCSSITRLSLCCDIGFRGTPSWNKLKSLTLRPILCECNIEDLVHQIMLGSPVLEVFELELRNCHDWENLNIMSRSLKWLKISYDVPGIEIPLNTLSICCTNLETLAIKGLFKCLFTDVSSLTNATLDFYNGGRNCGLYINFLGENLPHIFSTIQNVEKFASRDLFVQVFGASRKKYLLSPLPNVKFLELVVHLRCIEFSDVIDLLGIFPNLKYFIFESRDFSKPHVFNTVNYMEFETNIPKSLLLQLKIVEINARAQLFDSSVFGFIEFLLKHAVMLKKLVIRPKRITLRQHKRFSEKLLSMPRSSPTAQVILKGN